MMRDFQIKLLLCLFLFLSCFQVNLLNSVTNKTFFKYNPVGQNLVFQNSMSSFFINKMKTNKHIFNNFFIGCSVFYEESTSSNDLARYFFPNNKTELVIKGHNATGTVGGVPGDRDVFAEWLGIPSTNDLTDSDEHRFSSKIKISPSLERVGTTIYLYKTIFKNFYFSLFFPFEEVKTNAHLQEFDVTGERPKDSDPSPASLYFEEPLNATQAFVHPLMKYGKIDNQPHKLAGLADIKARIGYTKKFNDDSNFDLYASLVIPTGYKPKAEYLFEPIVGNANHVGIGAGFNLNLEIIENFSFISNVDYQYLFKNEEKRSFDLKENGPWSRYMAATIGLPRTRPERLINYLTQGLNVTPGSLLNCLFAFHYNQGIFNLEIGSNLQYQAEEKVALKKVWGERVGITFYREDDNAHSLIDSRAIERTYSKAKINSAMIIDLASPNIDDPGKFIEQNNINLDSAKHPSFASYLLYASIGVEGKLNEKPFLFNLGGSYNIGSSNKALDCWNIWLQTNISI